MGLFDGIFNTGPQDDARAAQVAGINQGYTTATGAINTGQGNTNTDFASGLAPISTNLSVDQGGQNTYADATGANGAAGYTRAVNNFQNGPGFNFALDQGSQNVMRNKNATGQLASGGTNIDLQTLGIGMENQQCQNYIQNLLPFVGASTANAATGANVDVAKAGTDTDFAKTLANLGWSQGTGVGNANANADLSQINTNGNVLNAGMQGLKFAAGMVPYL